MSFLMANWKCLLEVHTCWYHWKITPYINAMIIRTPTVILSFDSSSEKDYPTVTRSPRQQITRLLLQSRCNSPFRFVMYRFWKPGSVILFWHASWLSEMNTCIPNTTHNHAASCSVKLSPSLKSSGVAFINVECAQKEAYAVFDTNFGIYQKQPWYGKCAHLHTLIHNMFDWCSLQYTLETICKPTY